MHRPTLPGPALASLGWTSGRETAFRLLADLRRQPGRVTSAGSLTVVATSYGHVQVIVQRRFRRFVASQADLLGRRHREAGKAAARKGWQHG